MSNLSAELQDAHSSFYDQALEVLSDQGVNTFLDYLEFLRNDEYALPVQKFLKQTSVKATTRVFPGGDQDLIFASSNPKLTEKDEIPSSTLLWLSQYTENINEYASECAEEYQRNYLNRSVKGTRKKGYHELLDVLNGFGLISYPSGGRADYLKQECPGSVFSDVYFTNLFKFGTDDEWEAEQLPDELNQLSYSCLIDEIEAVEPKMIFAFGDKIQDRIGDHKPRPLTADTPDYDSVDSIERHGYAYEVDIPDETSNRASDRTIILTVAHPSQPWYQARGQQSSPSDSEDIEFAEILTHTYR